MLLDLTRFGVVGTAGFVVDTATLYLALALGAGPYGGRLLSYLVAATATWLLNRRWTFRDRRGADPMRQWALFLAVNAVGFLANYGAYALLVANLGAVAAYPVLGVAAGAIAGLGGNFALSRRFVFASAPATGLGLSATKR